MDFTSVDIAVHLILIATVVWAIAGNPVKVKAHRDGGAVRFPMMGRARIALLMAAVTLGWRAGMRYQAGQDPLVPALLAAALLLFWLFAREVVVDDKGVRQTRLFGKLVAPNLRWKQVLRAEVSIRRKGGRDRATIRVFDKNGVALVHGGALVDPQGFVEELGSRGVKLVETS